MMNLIARPLIILRCAGYSRRPGAKLVLPPSPTAATTTTGLRWKVMSISETPHDCEVLEKPCTLVLLEDPWFYQTAWHDSLQANVPSRHGMAFASLTLDGTFSSSTTSSTYLNGMIDEMKADLPDIHDAVLVTRGPIASRVALFYLESFPLKGLVMVDPFSFDRPHKNDDEDNRFFSQQVLQNFGLTSKDMLEMEEIALCQRLIQEASEKHLKLEPNSVPMLVVQSTDNPMIAANCQQVAERHGDPDGPFGEVMLKQILGGDPELTMSEIDDWVESIL